MKTSVTSSILPQFSPYQSQQQLKTSDTAQAQVNLVTKEGDQITINHAVNNSSMQKNMMSYKDIERSLSADVTVNQFSYTVKGDLNEQELADLSQLLDKLGNIAGDFFSGNTEQAIAGAMKIGDMGSIAKLEASFLQTTTIHSYLKGPHPLPEMQNALLDEVFASHRQKLKEDAILAEEALQAQWKQFMDYFDERNIEELNNESKTKKHSHSIAKTAEQMFKDAQKTMSEHPRLSPFIPSIADLAINGASRKHAENEHTLNDKLKKQFAQEYRNWLI